MKLKKILLITIIILSILTMTCVSASQNITADDADIDEQDIVSEIDTEPNITVPSKIWKYGENEITIESNEESHVNITGAITYDSDLTAGKTSIPLNNMSIGTNNIFINYLSNTYNLQKEYNITVLRENPDWNMELDGMDGDMLYGPPWDHEYMDILITVTNAPEGLTGNFSFYCNGILSSTFNALDSDHISNGKYEFYHGEYFECETYNFTVSYSGDDYFKPVQKSIILNFTTVFIRIPTEIALGYDDNVQVYSSYTPEATVIIKVNGKEKYRYSVSNDYEDYVDIDYSLNYLKPNNSYEIEVILTSLYEKVTKKATVNVTDIVKDYIKIYSNSEYVYDEYNYPIQIKSPVDLDVYVDGEKVNSSFTDGICKVDVNSLKPGLHNITATYSGDEKYLKSSAQADFKVIVKAKDIPYVEQYDLAYYILTLPEDVAGNLTLQIEKDGNTEYKTIEIKNCNVNETLPTNHIGTYTVKGHFTGNYDLNEIFTKYRVDEKGKWRWSTYSYLYLNDPFNLTLSLPEDAKGNLSLEIKKDDGDYYLYKQVEIKNGTADIPLPTNHIGEYEFKTNFSGNYEMEEYIRSYTVYSKFNIDALPWNVDYNTPQEISLKLPEDGIGTLTVEIKRHKNDSYVTYKSVDLINGEASIDFPTNHVGIFYYNVFYSGNYEIYNRTNYSTTVKPIYYFENYDLTVIGDNEWQGSVVIKPEIAGRPPALSAEVVNGSCKLDLSSLEKEWYNFIFNDLNETIMEFTTSLTPVEITAKDSTMYYNDGTAFKAKIYANDQPLKAYQTVTLKIGSKTYTVKTNAKGEISKKFTLTPGKYTVKIIYKDGSTSKKLTVKHVLTLKSVKVKKSAKKLVLTATLKNKKAIKNKQVTFKFKGKTYKAKTNSKGIAKVTIKSSVLKKLKAGKKITYQATYLKDTVKKTVKVQK